MYHIRPNLILGFHGCDREVGLNLISRPNTIRKSQEAYDWLGHGFYVWENSLDRAFQWAKDKKKRGALKQPMVIGVVLQLGHCLDFTDTAHTMLLGKYFQGMKQELEVIGKPLPSNKDLPNDIYKEKILRELDCSVIEYMHQKIQEQITEDIAKRGFSELKPFDSVRGMFTEGGPAFEGAGIQLKNHIQLCIRNLDCIKGIFLPRHESSF